MPSYLSGYTKRIPITIDNVNVDSDRTDHAHPVNFAANTDIGGDIDSSGYNIRFTSSDGTTLLKYERKSFNLSGGSATGRFFVKIPTITSAIPTVIYMYFKAASPSDGADPTNVWDSGFEGVWHMEQDPSGSAPQILDSTSHGRHLSTSGSMISGDLVSGQDGHAISFDGSNDELLDPLGNGVGSLIAIFSGTPNANLEGIITRGSSSEISGFGFMSQGSRFGIGVYADGNTYYTGPWSFDASPASTGTHYYSMSTAASSNYNIYKDGVNLHSGSTSGQSLSNPLDPWRIGKWDGVGFSPSTYEEIRVSSVARPDAYHKFVYAELFEADNENTFGAMETSGGGGTTYNETGSGTITIGGTGLVQETITLTGNGTVTLGGIGIVLKTITETGSGTLTISGTGTPQYNSNQSGSGILIINGIGDIQYNGNQSGSGTITIGGTEIPSVVGTVTGSGNLIISGTGIVQETITLTGSGIVTIGGFGTSGNVNTDVGSGTLTISGTGVVQYTGSQVGAGTLVIGGTGVSQEAASNIGSGTLTLDGTGVVQETITLTGSGHLTLGGTGTSGNENTDVGSGGVTISGTGIPQYNGNTVGTGAVTINGTGTVQYNANVPGSGCPTIGGTGSVQYITSIIGSGTLLLSGAGDVSNAIIIVACTGIHVDGLVSTSIFIDGLVDTAIFITQCGDC